MKTQVSLEPFFSSLRAFRLGQHPATPHRSSVCICGPDVEAGGLRLNKADTFFPMTSAAEKVAYEQGEITWGGNSGGGSHEFRRQTKGWTYSSGCFRAKGTPLLVVSTYWSGLTALHLRPNVCLRNSNNGAWSELPPHVISPCSHEPEAAAKYALLLRLITVIASDGKVHLGGAPGHHC